MHRWDGLLNLYIDEYSARGLSPATVRMVHRELERWGSWLKRKRPRPDLADLDPELIVEYIRQRNVFRARSTLSGCISVMRCFGEFLVHERMWQANPLRWIRGPKLDPRCRLPKRLGGESLKKLWQAAASSREAYQRHMWITAISVLYGTGLRRGELSRIDIEDWNNEEGVLKIDGRKTGLQRHVPVPDLVYRCIESYLPRRHNLLERHGRLSEQALFVNKLGTRLSASSISRGVHQLANRAKVPLVSLHQFRHTCASDLLEEGLTLPEVKAVLGHEVISTTVRYLHIENRQKHEAMKRHPLNDWLVGGNGKETRS